MGFLGQIGAYVKALALETATGAILFADVVALLTLAAFPRLETELGTGTWALVIAMAGLAIGGFQLYRRREPLLPAGAAFIELGSLHADARMAGIDALFELSADRHGGLARRILTRAALHHQWADVRRAAALCLGEVAIRRRHELAVSRKIAAGQGRRARAVQFASRVAAAKQDGTAIRALGVLLADLQRMAPVDDRLRAVRLLDQLPGKQSTRYLAAAVKRRPFRRPEDEADDIQVRAAAVEALGHIGAAVIDTIGPLTEDAELRKAAIQALAELGPEGSRDRQTGIQELVRRAAGDQDGIEGALMNRRDLPQRIKPLLGQSELGPKAADLLGQLVARETRGPESLLDDWPSRAAPDPRQAGAAAALREAVRSGTEETRRYCAEALPRGPIGVRELITLLDERPEEVLAAFASAPPSATKEWKESSEEPDAVVTRILKSLQEGTVTERAGAAEAIGALRITSCTSDLARVAADSAVPEPIRVAAIKGLGKMAHELAVPPLLAIVRDPAAPRFAEEAVAALRRLAYGYGFMRIDRVQAAEAALTELTDD